MGNKISAKCKICDFETTFNYGGNKMNFQINCPVPAINLETGRFVNINYISEVNNSKYKFYSNKELKDGNKNCYTLDNFDLKLNRNNNFCPNCKKFKLDFEITMYMD